MLLVAVLAMAPAALAQTNTEPVSLWDFSGRAAVGGGYRDNVLLTSVAPESSSFIEASGDFSAIYLSDGGTLVSFFVMGELYRYLDIQEVTDEELFYATVQLETPIGQHHRLGSEVQYFYENQVLDVSETEVELNRLLVVGHSLYVKPNWTWDLGGHWEMFVQGTALRQIYQSDELDDYWEGLGEVKLKRAYGRRSYVALGYEYRQRLYDSREQYDSAGFAVPGTSLTYRYHEFGGEWRHYWDEARQWRTTLRAGYLLNQDNGSGYFDYDRVQASLQVRWQRGGWDASLQARGSWYAYPNQSVAAAERERSYYALELRTERMLDEQWLLYARAGREWNLSNDPLDEYNDWVASAGLGLEF